MTELIILVGVVTTILWLVIGWRAMLAHEKIADAIALHLMLLAKQNEESKALRQEIARQD
jgi:hypothetical protein